VDERVSGWPRRAQTAQLGSGNDVAPWARNASTSRPTTGGAAIINAAGSAVNATARLRSAAGWPATAAIAAWTCAADRVGSVANTAATTCRCRCSPLTDGSLSR
jgi:hypothetical protein